MSVPILVSRLTIVNDGKRFKKGSLWYSTFLCECGNTKVIRERSVFSGSTKSCGKCPYLGPDLTNQRFVKLTAISRAGLQHGSMCWNCICDCGKTSVVPGWCLKKGSTKSCGCLRFLGGKNNPKWKGFGDISSHFWHTICNHAKDRNLDVKITIQDAWELFQEQKGLCALTGVPIHFAEKFKDSKTASLDRIDSSKGYEKGNIQWVHKDINWFKNKWSQQEFIKMCQAVVDHSKK